MFARPQSRPSSDDRIATRYVRKDQVQADWKLQWLQTIGAERPDGSRRWGSGSASRRRSVYRLDFGARSWYTRHARASVKSLILLSLVKRRGNPSLSATYMYQGSYLIDKS
jgi:hypothetical protein